jgi:serine acetyltransferase
LPGDATAWVLQDWAANAATPKGRAITLLFRLAQLAGRSGLPRPLRVAATTALRVVLELMFRVELPWRLEVGPGLRVFHGTGLVVHEQVRLGAGCVLRHATSIGLAHTDDVNGAPTLGDEVVVGTQVVILGPVTIGDRAIVGAGSIVVDDVAPGTVVGGNPARYLRDRRPEDS